MAITVIRDIISKTLLDGVNRIHVKTDSMSLVNSCFITHVYHVNWLAIHARIYLSIVFFKKRGVAVASFFLIPLIFGVTFVHMYFVNYYFQKKPKIIILTTLEEIERK